MTSRERLVAAASGDEVDQKPVIAWPFPREDSDAMVFPAETARSVIEAAGDKLALIEVVNPFGLSLQRNIDLNKEIKDDPERGNVVLSDLVDEVRRHIRDALDNGADGVLYCLHGARALYCTPMQYGGHYLERDRELLSEIGDARFNMVFVVGEADVYVDFVSDLPAHAFGWDTEDSKITPAQVRQMRKGAMASEDPDSDILLHLGSEHVSKVLESCVNADEGHG